MTGPITLISFICKLASSKPYNHPPPLILTQAICPLNQLRTRSPKFNDHPYASKPTRILQTQQSYMLHWLTFLKETTRKWKDKKAFFRPSLDLSFLESVRHNKLLFLWASILRTGEIRSISDPGILKCIQTGHTRPEHLDPEPKGSNSKTNWSLHCQPETSWLTTICQWLLSYNPIPHFWSNKTHSPHPSRMVRFPSPSPSLPLGK